MDTIFALSTAPGKAGVAIVRVSGPAAFGTVAHLAGRVPAPRRATRARLAVSGEVIDDALVLCFAAGASFTGEDVAEYHLHGSKAVVARIMAWLAAQPGLRPADPGEFTRRALEAGLMDLAQVEGLADLVEAETEAQRRLAIRAMGGALRRRADQWRARLLEAEALIAALIDFSDEELPDDLVQRIDLVLADLIAAWQSEVRGSWIAERVRDGFEVAIVGVPNVGKSTLLNACAGRDAAITSSVAGTTRDVIEVRMDLRGLPVTLLDMAGLRDGIDEIETIGVMRARERAAAADLRVFLVDDSGLPPGVVVEPGDIVCQAKADLRPDVEAGVSGLTGAGVSRLLEDIATRMEQRAAMIGDMTHLRHRKALEEAMAALESARDLLEDGSGRIDLAAESLRLARLCMERLVGRIGIEDVLGEVFGRFCIGK